MAGVAATTVTILPGCTNSSSDEAESDPVVVEEDSATQVMGEDGAFDYEELEFEQRGEWSLPLGNVLLPGEGTWLPVTTAGSSAVPMVKASAFSVETGELVEVVGEPISRPAANIVVYDVRCSDSTYAWVELNTLSRAWSLYAAAFAGGALTATPSLLWEADAEWDPPRFAVAGNRVVWQVMPSLSGSSTGEHSFCYLWKAGASEATAVVESPGRFATAPAISGSTLTLAPRVRANEGQYYGITAYSLTDDCATIIDRLVMPEGVSPFHAVRMGDVFAFSVEADYSYGGLLGSMGTYIGTSTGGFVTVPLEPFANVSGTGDLLVVKSRASYYVVDLRKGSYTFLSCVDRSLDYGEYPARVGDTSTFVTFATVKDQDTGYPSAVTVRAFDLTHASVVQHDEEEGSDEEGSDGGDATAGEDGGAADGLDESSPDASGDEGDLAYA